MDSSVYDQAYFLDGKRSKKSLYENYSWMPDMTIPMVQKIIEHCGIDRDDSILDYGCARGYVVRAFRELGYQSYGVDVSQWAINNCDETVKMYVNHANYLTEQHDWIIAKDVLEHVGPVKEVAEVMMAFAKKGIFVVVPLADAPGSPYVVPDYEKDITHLWRWPMSWWFDVFMKEGWSVECSYRIPGVKDNYFKPGWERGNGFITARRQKEQQCQA